MNSSTTERSETHPELIERLQRFAARQPMVAPPEDIAASLPVDPCPVCSGQPDVEECSIPGTGWAVGCYKMIPFEHFVGVNGDSRLDAVRAWNVEAYKVGAMARGVSQ